MSNKNKNVPEHIIERRQDQLRKRIERRRKAASFIGGPIILAVAAAGYVGVNKGLDKLAHIDTAEAAASVMSPKPELITVPYTVGDTPQEQLVSEITSDMHQYAPNQHPSEANSVIQTYLPPEDQARYNVHGGEKFNFTVNTRTGKIVPLEPVGSSASG